MTTIDLAALEERVMRKHLATIAGTEFDPTTWPTTPPPATDTPAPDVPQFPREQWVTYPNKRAVILTWCEVWLDHGFDATDPTYLFLLSVGGRERIA